MDGCSIPCSIFTIFVIFLCIVCLCLFAGLAVFLGEYQIDFNPVFQDSGPAVVHTPMIIRPTHQSPALATPFSEPGDPRGAVIEPVELVSTETLKTLQETIIPANDLRVLAYRLKGIENIPQTLEPPTSPLQVGATKSFWVTNTDTNAKFQVSATLRYVTEHLYFWVEDGVRYNPDHLKTLCETFENQIYPTNREFFGSEWKPGVDGDPHLYVLFAGGLGGRVAGYFSSNDSYHPLAHPYSNGHEMFLISSDLNSLNDPFLYGVLAHEFQHMIHWHRDRNETTWLNEGFSELAAFINGYYLGGFDSRYLREPDIQLNDWPNNSASTTPHYGASFLYVLYFLDRFGEDSTKALVGEETNGLESIDIVLEQMNITDHLSGAVIGADDVFSDWVVTSYLQDETVSDGRYVYSSYPDAPKPQPTEEIRRCPTDMLTRDVRQYGVDYIAIRCAGEYTLSFEGSISTRVLPVDPYSGSYYFWSNKGDESSMTLTRTFDFTAHTGPLSLSYWTWYDLEKDYDYVYLLASIDGERWQILTTPSGTESNLSGNSYGWAYNGTSGGWIQERVDLSAFAGNEIQVRFKYVTDAAVHGEGFLLDALSIPEIGYYTDFEDDNDGWETAGFARIQNILPQNYRVSLIYLGQDTWVETFSLGPDSTLLQPIQIGEGVKEVILVVSGATRFTREPAPYRFSIQP
jgi:immune inhibitor A